MTLASLRSRIRSHAQPLLHPEAGDSEVHSHQEAGCASVPPNPPLQTANPLIAPKMSDSSTAWPI